MTEHKYKTTYYTTNGYYSIDVEGELDIDGVMKHATENVLKSDYIVLASPTSPESGEPQRRTIIVREHLVALAIEEELEEP